MPTYNNLSEMPGFSKQRHLAILGIILGGVAAILDQGFSVRDLTNGGLLLALIVFLLLFYVLLPYMPLPSRKMAQAYYSSFGIMFAGVGAVLLAAVILKRLSEFF